MNITSNWCGDTASTGFEPSLLGEVGRRSLPAFVPFARPRFSSPRLDALEVAWWDRYGTLIDRVWGFPQVVCETLRRPYVAKTSEYFSAGPNNGVIVELGCGSGWFGRMLSEYGHRVIGLDASDTQIRLARQKAAQAGKTEQCRYVCSPDLDVIRTLGPIQGVVIHCFLHHLYWQELEELFGELMAVLPPATRVMIFEPVYLSEYKSPCSATTGIAHDCLTLIRSEIEVLRNIVRQKKVFDTATQHAVEALIGESTAQGFFFSPKEVPFFEGELRQFLASYLTIRHDEIVSVLDIDVAQTLALLTEPAWQEKLCHVLLPQFQALDRRAAAEPDFSDAFSDRYVFKCYFGERP